MLAADVSLPVASMPSVGLIEVTRILVRSRGASCEVMMTPLMTLALTDPI